MRWYRCLRAAAAFTFLLPGFATAQAGKTAANLPKFEYSRTLWTVNDGLPEDTVQAMLESADRRMWIGTTGGLARFDGSQIESKTTLGAANSIFCLVRGKDGTLWAGTEGGGVLRITSQGVKVYSTAQGLTDGFVRSIYQDSRSRLWVGTDDGLFLLEGERLRRVDQPPHLAPLAVHSITEDTGHRIWAGGSRLVAINPDGSAQEFTLQGAYSETRVKVLLQTSDGTMWAGTVGGLLAQHGPRGDHFHAIAGIHATVRTLLQTNDGTLWIGTIGKGIFTMHGGHLSHLDSPGLLPSDTVLSIFEDDQQQVWIGTQAGLVRLNKTAVSVVALPEGGDPDFETLSGDATGDVWVAAQSLYLIHGGAAKRQAYPQIGNAAVRNVYRARDGALWIGTDGTGAYRIRAAGTAHFTAPAQLTNNFIRGFLEGRDGTMWIATDEGLSRIRGDHATKYTPADGLAFFSTRSLLEDRDGSLWIGTDHGLSRLRDGRFQQDAATLALAQEKVWSILQDRSGALWFGTRDHGLYRYAGGTILHLTTAQGLPSDSVFQILQDSSGRFWITGPNTIASAAEAQMDVALTPAEQQLSVEVYRMPFGAEGAQIYGGRQPAGYIAPDDSVWLPTSRGAAHIAGAVHIAMSAPHALLDAVVEDGRSVAPQWQMSIPASTVRLSFAFTAVSLLPQEGVRFRYKLENFENAWNIPASTLAGVPAINRIATYTNLRAGHYKFRVQAFNTSAPDKVSEFDLALVKVPFFYETWWFYTLCGVALTLMAWGVYQLRMRQIRTDFAAMLKERSRLAREMHDTVIQGCTGISALLEAVVSTPDDQSAARAELLDYARVQAQSTINEARHAIWNMRHDERETEVDLIAALHGIVNQSARDSATEVLFTHSVDNLPLPASTAHELLMTVREAVYNSVQHSGAHSVAVAVNMTSAGVAAISIKDAGRGFLPSSPGTVQPGHYGIVGMRERMQRLGAQFDLSSSQGQGTTVTILLRYMEQHD